MTLESHIVTLVQEHPDWTARQIAEVLKCSTAHVYGTARRCSLNLRRGSRRPDSIFALGRAARCAGLTVEMIEKMSPNS